MNLEENNKNKQKTTEDDFLLEGHKLNFDEFNDFHPTLIPSTFKVFVIDIMDNYHKTSALFKFILEKNEITIRALAVTRAILFEQPTHFVAWWYRIQIVEQLHIDQQTEKSFLHEITPIAFKTYQYWNYRLWFTNYYENDSFDFEEIKNIIELDVRNFHAWKYFVQMAKKYQNYEDFMKMIDYFIEKNHFNNSAWNARHSLLELIGPIDADNELIYAINKISPSGGNEAVCKESGAFK